MQISEFISKISKMLLVLLCCCMVTLMHCAPLAERIVDMTHTFDDTTLHFPTTIEYKMDTSVINESSVSPENPWIQNELYSSSTHVGTHMDAPRDVVRDGKTIDQLDVAHFIAPAAVVDITAKAELDPDATVSVEDLSHWETTTGQNLDGTILLLRTGWGKKWGNRTAYFGTPENDPGKLHFPGMSEEAAQWLVDNRNIVGVGIDTLSYDKGSTVDFPAHRILLGHGIFGLENVARMEDIPIYGAKLYVLPMKIGGGSGAPVRILATFPEVVFSRQLMSMNQMMMDPNRTVFIMDK